MNSLIKNPMSRWLSWLVAKVYYERKYSMQHLKICYLARLSDCKFGLYNTLYDGAIVSQATIGDFTYVGENNKITKATIGKFCCFGKDVIVGLGRHPSKDFVSNHPIFYSPLRQSQITFSEKSHFQEFMEVRIGNDVWVGHRALIVDGVSIGNGAIIAAGAVVNKDVPPYAIVGGVPARIIRYRFTEDEIIYLEMFKWWDRDIEWLKENAEKFHDIKNLIKLGRENFKK